MSSRKAARWPAWISLFVAAGLVILPLPESFTPFRPPWVTIAIIYWIMMWPRVFGLGSAWFMGLCLDILQGELLGQHALALTVVAYLTVRFHLQIRIFPLWQLTMTVFALLAIEAFILFWIDGVAGNPAIGWPRWTQVLAGMVLWPVAMAILDRTREGAERSDPTFT